VAKPLVRGSEAKPPEVERFYIQNLAAVIFQCREIETETENIQISSVKLKR
jgi:hypothetical protein